MCENCDKFYETLKGKNLDEAADFIYEFFYNPEDGEIRQKSLEVARDAMKLAHKLVTNQKPGEANALMFAAIIAAVFVNVPPTLLRANVEDYLEQAIFIREKTDVGFKQFMESMDNIQIAVFNDKETKH